MALNFWVANDYNAFITGSTFVSNGSATGKVWAVNTDINNYSVGTALPVSTTDSSFMIINPNKVIGGTNTQNTAVNVAPFPSTNYTMDNLNGVPNPIIDPLLTAQQNSIYSDYMTCAGMTWSLLPQNGQVTLDDTDLTLTGTDNSLNIFQIDPYDVAGSGMNVQSITSINIVVPDGSTILVNWAAPSINIVDFTFNFDTLYNGVPITPAQAQYLVWNDRRLNTNLILTKDMYGTILAPEANLQTGTVTVYGKIITFGLSGSGNTVYYPFLGNLPDTYDPSNTFYCISLTTTTTTTTSTTTTTTTTTACQQPPVIKASNVCLTVGDSFNPLEKVSAYNCDGANITNLIVVKSNNVDTTQAGLYTVTYEVTSPTNGKITVKQIYVRVLAKSVYHQAVSDMIESVALEQTALSHILNAEGEKIQKVLDMNPTTDDLISVNTSVKDMVNSIGRLELILQAKLEAVECEICPECKFPPQ